MMVKSQNNDNWSVGFLETSGIVLRFVSAPLLKERAVSSNETTEHAGLSKQQFLIFV